MDTALYAHTVPGQDSGTWEPLSKHLEAVGAQAGRLADAFGAAAWGEALGRAHDIGKASAAFQNYIRASNPNESADAGEFGEDTLFNSAGRRVDHATCGARHLVLASPGLPGHMLAFCVAGHHTGLPNEHALSSELERSTLRYKLSDRYEIEPVAERDLSLANVKPVLLPALRLVNAKDLEKCGFQLSVLTRMLFSCLVDADRICTEQFCNPEQAALRKQDRPGLDALGEKLSATLLRKQRDASPTEINRFRGQILESCLRAAESTPGLFSLQVPTGGGKTLSSLAFALEHAKHHPRLRRVVVAIPFTSIIEQTADQYRLALEGLADTALIEHHTNLQPARATRSNQFGAENWDAPLIITTNVQLLESLFAAATTACRKLHSLANSIIILDEAQVLPMELLTPTLAMLQELERNYGCTIVLCTATQPALSYRPEFPIGLKGVRPIIPEPKALYAKMIRVKVERVGMLTDDELISRLLQHPKVLCIVNTREHAARLYRKLCAAEPEGHRCFHLSTLMCGAHRREALKAARQHIESGPCRIISTQLIEAGVDIDLPIVYRAEAGFDSIAQAAGRCNREGKQKLGHTYVFEVEKKDLPPGLLRSAAETAKGLSRRDPLAPESIEAYFRDHYWKHSGDWDKHGIMAMTRLDARAGGTGVFQFRDIEKAYRIIRDAQLPILVPYGPDATNYIAQLLRRKVEFVPQRQLQPYLVSVPKRALDELIRARVVEPHESGVYLCLRGDEGAYSQETGLRLSSHDLDSGVWGV